MQFEKKILVLGPYEPNYNQSGQIYQLNDAYFLTIISTYLISFVFGVWFIGEWLKSNYIFTETDLDYVKLIFSGWDWKTRSRSSSSHAKRNIEKEILELLEEQKSESERLNAHKTQMLNIRRTFLWILSVLVIITNCSVVIIAKHYIKPPYDSYGVAGIVWLVSEISCLVFGGVAKYEQYSKYTELLLAVLRNMCTYNTSLYILVFYTLIYKFKETHCCWEDEIGDQMYTLLIASIGSEIGFAIRSILSRVKAKKVEQYPEMKVEKQAAHVIKLQTISWIGILWAPMIPLVTLVPLLVVLATNCMNIFVLKLKPKQVFRVSRAKFLFLVAVQVCLWIDILISFIILFFEFEFAKPTKNCTPYRGFLTPYQSTSIYKKLDGTVNIRWGLDSK